MAEQSIQVTSRQVFTPKKDKEQSGQVSPFNTVSIPDARSHNGFSTFPALKSDISAKDNGYCDVKIHLDAEYDLSYPTGGKTDSGKAEYIHERVTGQSLVDLLQENLSKKKEQTQEQTKNVFVNNVSDQCIKPVQSKEGRTDLSRVFFRGFGDRPDFSIVLPAKQTAIPSTRKNKLPIEGRHNVNLGPEDASHDCSTRGADGKFEHFTMTSGEIKAHYEAQQKAYMTERRAKDKEETPVPVASQPQSQVIADDDYAID